MPPRTLTPIVPALVLALLLSMVPSSSPGQLLQLEEVDRFETPKGVQDVCVVGDYAYTVENNTDPTQCFFRVYNIADPLNPVELVSQNSLYGQTGKGIKVVPYLNWLLVLVEGRGLLVITRLDTYQSCAIGGEKKYNNYPYPVEVAYDADAALVFVLDSLYGDRVIHSLDMSYPYSPTLVDRSDNLVNAPDYIADFCCNPTDGPTYDGILKWCGRYDTPYVSHHFGGLLYNAYGNFTYVSGSGSFYGDFALATGEELEAIAWRNISGTNYTCVVSNRALYTALQNDTVIAKTSMEWWSTQDMDFLGAALLVSRSQGLQAFDVSDPYAPQLMDSVEEYYAHGVTLIGDNILMGQGYTTATGNLITYSLVEQPVPVLVNPADGTILASPAPIVFQWEPLDGAVFYVVEVSSSPGFEPENIVHSNTTDGQSYEWTLVQADGTLYWRVKGYIGTDFSPPSDTWSVTYNFEFLVYEPLPDPFSFAALPTQTPTALFNHPVDVATITDDTFLAWGEQSGPMPMDFGFVLGSYRVVGEGLEEFFPGEKVTAMFGPDVASTYGETLESPYTWTYNIAAVGTGEFLTNNGYAQPGECTGVALADVDNDGDPDVVSIQMHQTTMTVMKNKGRGVFDPCVVYDAVEDPMCVTTGDFNGDGHIDVLTGDFMYGWTYFANDGSGHFAPGVNAGNSPFYDLAPVDLDGDGDLDVLTADPGGVGLLLNDGNANFTEDAQYVPTLGDARDLSVGDFNGDGAMDVASTQVYDSKSVALIYNDGSGVLLPPVYLPMLSYTPTEVVSADFDNDGHLDIAAGHLTGVNDQPVVRVFLNDGQGGFPAHADFIIDDWALTALATGDIDNDGDIDIVVGREGSNELYETIVLLRNDGTGDFSDMTYLMQESTQDFYRPNELTMGDIDGDGSLDIVASEFTQAGTSVLFNQVVPGQVVLDGPAGGYVYAYATPYLYWYYLPNFGTQYTIQVDTEATFSNPITATGVTTLSGWNVDPALANGTYYWRVRAGNQVGDGPWSEVWSFGVAVVNTSCPTLFTHDGSGFVEENVLLTRCAKTGYQEVVTDHYLLPTDALGTGSELRFELRELEPEVSYLEDLELLTIDHTEGTSITCTVDGQVMVYQESIAPLSAIDQYGKNRVDAVRDADGNVYRSDVPGYLILTFPQLEEGSSISLYAPKCPKPHLPSEALTATDPEGEAIADLTIETLTEDGEWSLLGDLPARDEPTLESVAVAAKSIEGETLTIRISWQGSFETDIICQRRSTGEIPAVKSWKVHESELRAVSAENPGVVELGGERPVELHLGDVFSFRFLVDQEPVFGTTRSYVLKATGRYEPQIEQQSESLPQRTTLQGNTPNPFNPSTEIRFDLVRSDRVSLRIYDLKGRLVRVLLDETRGPGNHGVVWDGCDDSGKRIASGTYFYTLQTGDFSDTKKMLMLK